jgi:hypothetical protein
MELFCVTLETNQIQPESEASRRAVACTACSRLHVTTILPPNYYEIGDINSQSLISPFLRFESEEKLRL